MLSTSMIHVSINTDSSVENRYDIPVEFLGCQIYDEILYRCDGGHGTYEEHGDIQVEYHECERGDIAEDASVFVQTGVEEGHLLEFDRSYDDRGDPHDDQCDDPLYHPPVPR